MPATATATAAEPRASNRLRDRDFDRALGARIRQVRIEAGLSQEKLAAAAGISFQQVQKYESGANRVTVYALGLIAAACKRPLADYIDELGKPAPAADHGPLALQMTRAFGALPSDAVRQHILALTRALAGEA